MKLRHLRKRFIVFFEKKKRRHLWWFQIRLEQALQKFYTFLEEKCSLSFYPVLTFKKWLKAYIVLCILFAWPIDGVWHDGKIGLLFVPYKFPIFWLISGCLAYAAAIKTYQYCMSHTIPWPHVNCYFISRSLKRGFYVNIDWRIYAEDGHHLLTHRTNGPAGLRITPESEECYTTWVYYGFPHRFDGPAKHFLKIDKADEYFLFGVKRSEQDFERITAGKTPLEIATECYMSYWVLRGNVIVWLKNNGYHELVQNLEIMYPR